MTTEALLVKTKDNSVIVLSVTYDSEAEKLRLIKQCERYCQSVSYDEFKSSGLPPSNVEFDKTNTDFLKEEIVGYHYIRQPDKFINEMKDNNFPARVRKNNTLHFDCRLPDSFFPEIIKNVAYHVKPVDEIYKVRYNKSSGKYEVADFKIRRAQVNHSKKELLIVRNHFNFNSDDYAKLQRMIGDFQAARRTNPKLTLRDFAHGIIDSKDYSLFCIYAKEQENVNHLDSTIDHELKHIKNSIFADGLALKDDYKQLSVDNMYRLCVENERSSYMQQLLHCINIYLKQGDYNDFSMFDSESSGFVNHLKTLKTKKDRLEYATNLPLLTVKMLEQFDINHKKYYDDSQFTNNVMNMAERVPLTASPDTDGETFNKLRSLYYHYIVYNPLTGKDESISLAKFITPEHEVAITADVRKKIIVPAEQRLRERNSDFELKKDELKLYLVAHAKELIRGSLGSSAYVNVIDGLHIGRLAEEKSHSAPIPGDRLSPKIPDDKAYWSDDLKKYWSKIDGYREIAKNNQEYTFKINDAQISYSDKNHVNIGSNADFELYVKLLKEPSNKNNVIEFAPTLSKEQALLLYIACTNYGHKMSGKVPTDLSGIDKLQGIPPAEMNKFNHLTGRRGGSSLVKPFAHGRESSGR